MACVLHKILSLLESVIDILYSPLISIAVVVATLAKSMVGYTVSSDIEVCNYV